MRKKIVTTRRRSVVGVSGAVRMLTAGPAGSASIDERSRVRAICTIIVDKLLYAKQLLRECQNKETDPAIIQRIAGDIAEIESKLAEVMADLYRFEAGSMTLSAPGDKEFEQADKLITDLAKLQAVSDNVTAILQLAIKLANLWRSGTGQSTAAASS